MVPLSSADPPALLGAKLCRMAGWQPCSVASIETEGFVLILNRWRGFVYRVCTYYVSCLSLAWAQLVPREDEHFGCLAS